MSAPVEGIVDFEYNRIVSYNNKEKKPKTQINLSNKRKIQKTETKQK